MKLWTLTVSVLLHAAPFLILFKGPLSPMLSPIWIEKGRNTPPIPTPVAARPTAAPQGEKVAASEPNATQKGLMTSSVEEWTRMGNTPPEYPYIAQKKGWEGRVELKVTIGPGHPNAVSLYKSSGYSVLDEAGISWAQQCRVQVESETEFLIPIVFQLKAGGGRH